MGSQGGRYRELEMSNAEVGAWKSPQLSPARCREDCHPGGEVTTAQGVSGSPLSTTAGQAQGRQNAEDSVPAFQEFIFQGEMRQPGMWGNPCSEEEQTEWRAEQGQCREPWAAPQRAGVRAQFGGAVGKLLQTEQVLKLHPGLALGRGSRQWRILGTRYRRGRKGGYSHLQRVRCH